MILLYVILLQDLFVDAKIVTENFDTCIYIVGNKLSSFKDIVLFNKEIKASDKNKKICFFYNKFDMFSDFLVKIPISKLFGNTIMALSYLNLNNPLKFTKLLSKLRDFFSNIIRKWF